MCSKPGCSATTVWIVAGGKLQLYFSVQNILSLFGILTASPVAWVHSGLSSYSTNFKKDAYDVIRVWGPADLLCFSVPLYLRLPVRPFPGILFDFYCYPLDYLSSTWFVFLFFINSTRFVMWYRLRGQLTSPYCEVPSKEVPECDL